MKNSEIYLTFFFTKHNIIQRHFPGKAFVCKLSLVWRRKLNSEQRRVCVYGTRLAKTRVSMAERFLVKGNKGKRDLERCCDGELNVACSETYLLMLKSPTQGGWK